MFNYLFQPPAIYLIIALIIAIAMPIILSQIRAWSRRTNRGFDLVSVTSIRSIAAMNQFTKVERSASITTTIMMTSYDIPDEVNAYVSIKRRSQRFCFIYRDNNEPVYTHHISNDCSITVGRNSLRIKDFELGIGRATPDYLFMLDRVFEDLELAMGRPVRHDHYMLIRQVMDECLKRESSDKPKENSLLGYTRKCAGNHQRTFDEQLDILDESINRIGRQ